MNLGETLTTVYSYIKFVTDFIRFVLYAAYVSLEAIYKVFFPPPLKPLDGEVILVTGSGNGIGKHICLQLARISSDVKIVCLDQNKFDNDLTVKELRSTGAKAFGYDVDISQRSHIEDVASKINKEVGNVTMVVNNAGIMPVGDFLSESADSLERTFEVNVLSHFWILKEFLPGMIESRYGHIVTINSFGGVMGTDKAVGYCGSKFAVNGYIESLKDEIMNLPGSPDIHFTTAYPYFVRTDLSNGLEYSPRFPTFTPVLEPEFVAQEVVDGIRRNREYVYCPSSLRLFAILAALIPRKLQRAGKNYLQLNFEPALVHNHVNHVSSKQKPADLALSD